MLSTVSLKLQAALHERRTQHSLRTKNLKLQTAMKKTGTMTTQWLWLTNLKWL